jgi:hypothetical protein
MTDAEREQLIFTRVRSLDEAVKVSYAEIGLACQEVEDGELWKHRCTSFSEWVKLACPWGWTKAWAAKADVKELRDIPIRDLAKIPQSNFDTLKKLPRAARGTADVITAAKTLHSDHFTQAMQTAYPDLHLERRTSMKFTPDETQSACIEDALKYAQLHGARNQTEALMMVAIAALDWWRMKEEELAVDRALRAMPPTGIQ